jgi:renalase
MPHILPKPGLMYGEDVNHLEREHCVVNIAIIGAGMAGLACAQQLQTAGHQVTIFEKSRGLGGRVATRRLHDTWMDHGVRYLEPQGPYSAALLEALRDRQIVDLWERSIAPAATEPFAPEMTQPRYVAPQGLTAVAKFMAQGLMIHRCQRVTAIVPTPQTWQLTLDSATTDHPPPPEADALVIAIPAPQAATLLEPLVQMHLPSHFLQTVQAVDFHPCMSVMAGYPSLKESSILPWTATPIDHPHLAWISQESTKQAQPPYPTLMLQSTAAFAQTYLDAEDLTAAGRLLIEAAAQHHNTPWMQSPDWVQVHRWRYAFVRQPATSSYLFTETPLPLICCGDWCGGDRVEAALRSGTDAAQHLMTYFSAQV